MINNEGLARKIETSPRLKRLLDRSASGMEVAEELYLAALARRPTRREIDIVEGHLRRAGAERRRALEDVLWAVLNSKEFLLRR